MKAIMKLSLLGFVLSFASLSLSAQEVDPWLDDTYLTQEDIAKQEAKERAEQERQYQEYLKAERERKAQRQLDLQAYKKRQREREIDAYNGYAQPDEDEYAYEDGANTYSRRRAERPNRRRVEIYGPYSARVHRFHGNGDIIISGADDVYINGAYYGSDFDRSYTNLYINTGWGVSSYYPWYSYDPFMHSSFHHYGYRPYYPYNPSSHILSHLLWDDYYPYYSPWYHSDFHSWGGYYGGYYGGYHDGYYHGAARRAYNDHYYHNPYRNGARSTNGYNRSSYAAYQRARSADAYSDRNNQSYGTRSYRGSARSGYTSGHSSRSYDRGTYRSQSSQSYSTSRSAHSYSTPRSSSSSHSYSRPSSSSQRSSSASSRRYHTGSRPTRGR